MHTSVDRSDDPNNSNTASANIAEFGVSSPGGGIVSNGPGTFACSASPGPADPDEPPQCPSTDSNDDVLAFDMAATTLRSKRSPIAASGRQREFAAKLES